MYFNKDRGMQSEHNKQNGQMILKKAARTDQDHVDVDRLKKKKRKQLFVHENNSRKRFGHPPTLLVFWL